MKALWLENGEISMKDISEPEVPVGEVLIKIIRAGICNTDLEMIKGYYPFTGVLGHEFVGRVIDDNAPQNLKNKIVVGEINATCRNCSFCEHNVRNHCLNRTVMGLIGRNGCFSEYISLPTQNLHIIPDEVSQTDACFVEPLAAAYEIQTQIDFKENDDVLVIGDGKLGLLVSLSLLNAPGNLHVYGHHKEKLKILEDTEKPVKTFAPDSTTENWDGKFDIVIECSGNSTGLQSGISWVKPRGKLVMKSTYAGNVSINFAPIVVKEISIIGSRCGPFQRAIRALRNGDVNVLPLLQEQFTIDNALVAIKKAQERGSRKIQIVF